MVTPNDYKGPDQFVHLHSHTLFSSLDGVAAPEQYAEQCIRQNCPAIAVTEHGHMASVPDMYLSCKKSGIKYIPGCFLPSQPVLTSEGVKEFDKLALNDLVLTDKNRFRHIRNLQVRNYNGEVVRVRAHGVEEIIATPEHPFLVCEVIDDGRSIRREIGMRPIGSVPRQKHLLTGAVTHGHGNAHGPQFRYYLCVPRLRDRGIAAESYFCRWLVQNSSVDDLLWVIGLWLARGELNSDGASFQLYDGETGLCDAVAGRLASLGLKTSTRRHDGSRPASSVVVHSMYFADMLSSTFGADRSSRYVPWWMIDGLGTSASRAMIGGVLACDIGTRRDGPWPGLCNQLLAWQVRLLMTRLGQYCAVLPVHGDDADVIWYTIRHHESGRHDDEFVYLPIYDICCDYYTGLVYNMEVDEDNTYNVGVPVHNCEIYYNDWEPVRHELEGRGVRIRSPGWRSNNPELAARMVRNRHLTLLCKNETGFHNLIKLTTQAYETGLFGVTQKQFNRIWFEKLCEFKEGLIVLSGCLNGPVCHELRYRQLKDRNGNVVLERSLRQCLADAVKYIKKFKAVFGDDYFIELQMPGVEDDEWVFRTLVMLADQYHIPVVLTNDCHYLKREDFQLQKIMMAIAQNTTVDSPNLFHVNSDEQYMKSRAELWARFRNNRYSDGIDDRKFEEMCDNTLLVAERCEPLKIDTDLKIPNISNADDELRRRVAIALKRTGLDKEVSRYVVDGREVTYIEQARIELDRIIDKGFSSYFLITSDLMNYGRCQGWLFGPRGSAGGSLVCYLLGIHAIDPLRWGLSFDRFLSPSRGGYMLDLSMPDPL